MSPALSPEAPSPQALSTEARPEPAVELASATLGALAGAGLAGVVSFLFRSERYLSAPAHLVDLALTGSLGAAYGVLRAALALPFGRPSKRPKLRDSLRFGVLVLLHLALVWLGLRLVLEREGDALSAHPPFARALSVSLAVAIAIASTVVEPLGRKLTWRWWLAVLGWAVLLAVSLANAWIFRDDFFEVHGAVVAVSGLMASGLVRASVVRLLARKGVGVGLIAASAALLLMPFFSPSNSVRLAIFRSPGALGGWVHGALFWRLPRAPAGTEPVGDPAWLADRSSNPATPPATARLVAGQPVVVMITIDALRADVLNSGRYDAYAPRLVALSRSSVAFTEARSPGTQTSVSLSALFSGRTFSELCWAKHGHGTNRFDYPANDPALRFTSVLDQHGIGTEKFGPLRFLANEFGVAPGFRTEHVAAEDRGRVRADEIVDPLLRRLAKAGPEPLFLYAHLMEPHAPYDQGKEKTGPAFDRYLSAVTVADEQIGRVVDALAAENLASRAILVVTSDHGESFGEHGTFEHSKTLHDELVRVPLIVHWEGALPRVVDEPVSLTDLGPTVLDLFAIDSPPTFVGESLVPFLEGKSPVLHRPILSEGRLSQSMLVEGIKVVRDGRRKTVELFDLKADPGETRNLYDARRTEAAGFLRSLEMFDASNRCGWSGYTPPYKP